MYSDTDEQIIIERDCEATLIPFGNKITLKKGEEAHITQ
ncbi:MAG: putative Fe-S cluster assembly protein SufT, partial [Candidatus Marinimicrobia bacterium]|nr:putative Fe-S cluster assembly protein SufT [Candidatus Neomarinimicrobiota bacterium]